MEENNFFKSHLTEVDPGMLTPNDTVIHKLLKEQKLEDGKCNINQNDIRNNISH